ncbi:MAG TPA: hypothetical protein PKN95_12765 [Verrucomicrobiota bacterium]|nr:hypothetical protein [Verrucomicrobiota bacterium]HNT15802.1 hypothetical protein [Verrucomicrobiota bacterium]
MLGICRERNIAEQTFYRWQRVFGMMEVSEARRLREKTPLPMAWIPQRLNMDPKAHLAHPRHRQRRGK